MSRRRERRFSSAHAIAIAALFFALGGGAYAAVTSLPPNSVGTRQLKKGSVTAKKFSPRVLKELKKIMRMSSRPPRPYSIGPAGPQGPKGEPGPKGATGPSDVYIAGSATHTLTNAYTEVASVSVPPGEYLIEAKTDIGSSTAGVGGAGGCLIVPALGAEAWDAGSAAFPGIAAQFTSTNISLAGAAALPSGGTIVLGCKENEGSLFTDDARVWATRVGSLHGPPLPID
jgi:hypothetical protein